jgi:diguanylate cyclase (GGDEF)-like protein
MSAPASSASLLPGEQAHALELHRRSRLGGVFYLTAWLLVAVYGGALERYPLLTLAIAGVFLAQTASRFVLYQRLLQRPARAARQTRLLWSLLLLNSATWGGLIIWVLLDPHLVGVDLISFVSTVALASAFAQVFAIDLVPAAIGTALLYVPALVMAWLLPGMTPLALAMSLHALYLGAAIISTHRDWQRKTELDDALRVERDRYARLSRTDPLTGLANRREFAEQLDRAVADTARPCALVLVDIDHFKAVNDTHGHPVGDACLVEVAQRLAAVYSDAVVIARLGGEEFGALSHASLDAASAQADLLRARLHDAPVDAGGTRVALTVSIGIAVTDGLGADAATRLFRAADAALYRAKAGGRDRVVVDGGLRS